MVTSRYLIAIGAVAVSAASPSYPVPASQPSGAALLDPAPVGISFEFFMWPSYMRNITPPLECIKHFDELYGRKTPIRIGGTTQDRATYDPDFDGYVSYHVDDPLVAPMELLFGPKYFDLIVEMGAETMIGFNRGHNNRTNTFAAALELKKRALEFVDSIELGNEPDLYLKFWNHPVATAPWNETQEGADAADWAEDFTKVWQEPLPILAAGGYAIPFPIEPNWPNLPHLIEVSYNQSVKAATKVYNGHIYAFSNASENELNLEMRHTRTVEDLNLLPVAEALADGKPYVIGETGFHGLDYEMDAMFGGAVQIVDKTLRALSMGINRLYYHQGTINQAFFNWWLDDQVNTPFYGGYMAALATVGGDHIIASDNGTDLYAQYIVYKDGKPIKVILINTDFFSGEGERPTTEFTLTELPACKVKAIRMTAPSSNTMTTRDQADMSVEPSIGGQYFANSDCSIQGEQEVEVLAVKRGQLKVQVAASEVVIISLV
ncbi:hypothetical protein F5X68DRAFT_230697 [Plectosphaerella plurivora]|uniref:Beta-glucuronidase C-terminal domain-containing protein n=1 Tax=Plectosphaerella plurivora TaxID=936078 RepID=A0A9P8VEY8_9PEZI|nr:hypothetical protein F5X68DRAFT_230697 [Plectosphaerella plurivora]